MLDQIYHAIDPVAFSLGAVEVRWYGLAYLFGFLLAGVVMWRTAKRWSSPITVDDILMIVVALAFGLIIGARLFYVVFYNLQYYIAHPDRILAFYEGGMSFHGGLVGAVVGGYLACRYLKVPFGAACDLAAIGAPIGLFFGRCANFVNGELWGAPCDLPWAVSFESGGSIPRHPSQLYEAMLEGVVLFVVLYLCSRREPPMWRYSYIGLFLVLYGVFRIAVEFVRVPDAQIGYLFGIVTMGQVLSAPLIVCGALLLALSFRMRIAQSDPRQRV